MKPASSTTTMTLSDLWTQFRLLQSPEAFSEAERCVLERFLQEEHRARERRRIEYLMKMSGIGRPKLFDDFDWTFNPKIPRDKIMEYIKTEFLKKPSNLVLIGAAGVGKSHLATALCHQAVLAGHQTVFITLFDFTAKLAKAKNPFSLIEYYAKVPLLCLDEVGYVVPTREQSDAIFQIISKRTEVRTTIVTTNLIPSQWGKIFDSVTASAILDRLSQNGRFIICEGRSYRSKK
jgi:DNA replication protein DnaC